MRAGTSRGEGGRKVISPVVVFLITTLTVRYVPASSESRILFTVRRWISLSMLSVVGMESLSFALVLIESM